MQFTGGETLSDSSEGGEIEIVPAGLVHRLDDSRCLYPWHRIDHVDWFGGKTDGRSAVARAADLAPEDDPFQAE